MDNKNFAPKIGEVYWMDFPYYPGSCQRGWRPGVVFQNNRGNTHSPNILALPTTSVIKRTEIPTNIVVRSRDSGLPQDSMIIANNPIPIPKECVGSYISTLPDEVMRRVTIGNLVAIGAACYIGLSDLVEVQTRTKQLNYVGR